MPATRYFGNQALAEISFLAVGTNVPQAPLNVLGAHQFSRTAVGAGVYTVVFADYIVAKTAITGGGDTINLPAVSPSNGARIIHIKDESGTAAANPITIDANGAQTIDGALTFVINTNFGSVSLYTNTSSAWFTF